MIKVIAFDLVGVLVHEKDIELTSKDKYNIKPNELLFLDDNILNINSAKELGIKTIKVDNQMNLFNEIEKAMD